MSTENRLETKLLELSEQAVRLLEFIRERGTDVRYEVEFVGGTRPVDTPYTSAGDLARVLRDNADRLFKSFEFDRLILEVEEAEERYQTEYADAVRDLDLGAVI